MRLPFRTLRESIRCHRTKEKRERRIANATVYSVESKVTELRQIGNKNSFYGAALDTGAERSVVGWRQARIYCKMMNSRMVLLSSNRIFRFGDQTCRSLGSLHIKVPVPTGTMDIYVDVVEPNVPLLLGLDLLDRHRLQFLTLTNELEHIPVYGASWRLPVTRKGGHGFLEWDVKNVLYTKSQLVKLHKHLYHPSSGKLLNLLKRATPDLVLGSGFSWG
jgi:hypothetical protein